MGAAKELMFELQQIRAVARELGIKPEDLECYDYEVREDGFRTLIVWDGEAPEGVSARQEGDELVSEVDLLEPDSGPEDL